MKKFLSLSYLFNVRTLGLGIYLNKEKDSGLSIVLSFIFLTLFFDFGDDFYDDSELKTN
jgi:hypothetical protein